MNKRPNKVCLGSFNFIKGVAICVVVLGHIALDFDVSRLTLFYPLFVVLGFLKTPFMPLFFIISGYGFVPNSVKNTFRKMAKALLLPYLVVAFVFTIAHPITVYLQTQDWNAAMDRGISVALAFLLGNPIPGKTFFGIKLYHCAIVWFLLALFWAYNILNLLLKRAHKRTQTAVVLVCAALGYGLFQKEFTYFCLPHGLIATGYFYVGYLLKKFKLIEKGLPCKWMYPAWIAVALVYASWGEFDLCYGKFRFFPIDYFGVVFLALLLLVIGIYLGRLEWKVFDVINSVGIHSYWVICIHSFEQKCLPWNSFVQLTEDWPNAGFALTLLIKAAIIAVGCKLLKRMNKWRYRKQKRAYAQKKLCSDND